VGTLDLFFLSQSADPSRRAWTIRQSDVVIGLLQLKQIRPVERDAFLGIALGCPWVGQGYGREALSAFLEAYFERIHFACVRLEVGMANERARRLYDALGFRETRRFWRDAGLAEPYRFLDEPRSAALRPYFRHATGGVYQLYSEMNLTAERWCTL
jgi:RimJ/RimL family protein N-acetyltransferase